MKKTVAYHQRHVMHDVAVCSIEQLEDLYDIVVDEDGTVWDNCEGKGFDTLQEWAVYTEAVNAEDGEDESSYGGKPGKYRYSDD